MKSIFDILSVIAKKKRELYKGTVIGITGSAGKTTLKETTISPNKNLGETSIIFILKMTN